METYRGPDGQWQPKMPTEAPKWLRAGLGGLAALVLLLVAIVSSYYTVAPEEEAVVLRLGRYVETTPPGLHFKLPFGIDRAIKVPVSEVRKLEFGFQTTRAAVRSQYRDSADPEVSTMLTGDLNIAEVEWVVQYRIVDARAWLFEVDNQEETIRDLAESGMRAVVGDHRVTEVLTDQRDRIKQLAKSQLQDACDQFKLGVRIETVELQNVTPPTSVRDSFNEVNSAQQERSRLENEAMREYNRVIPRARGQAEQQIEAAKGYAVDRVNRAKGDISRFEEMLKAYHESPAVTRKRLYLETIERVLPQVERIVVTRDGSVLQHMEVPAIKGGGR